MTATPTETQLLRMERNINSHVTVKGAEMNKTKRELKLEEILQDLSVRGKNKLIEKLFYLVTSKDIVLNISEGKATTTISNGFFISLRNAMNLSSIPLDVDQRLVDGEEVF